MALALAGSVSTAAQCPPDCFAGGGVAAADCLVQFGGIGAARTTCADGDPACDADGVVDGTCTFELTVCINVPGPGCTPDAVVGPVVGPAASSAARALAAGVAGLDPRRPGCATARVPVPLRAGLHGLAPATARIVVSAKGRRTDRDRLVLGCTPSAAAPSFAVVAPIFAARCATLGCHTVTLPNSTPPLETTVARSAVLDVPSLDVPSLKLVAPGDVAASWLARKILGRRLVDRSRLMPDGCPKTPPAGGCLTPADKAAIVGWIAGGAPD